ncbi:hypothetical protein [Cellulomonas sp. HD19AZ1]|uniref:hypothetical protein n=1 Tax=Cellulomonas TaxID=1707 RepID=UPI0010706CE4|nr:hypothetical protein [Cellulomonas sp. HD19AZ1]TFH72121.1 hypothetical protein E4A51_08385 [Cellulomonas sp. HD19AZ1]
MLSATGFGSVVPFLASGLLVGLLFREEYISKIGPIAVQPPFAATMVTPLLLALGTGMAHGTWPSAVVRRSWRTGASRAGSYALASVSSLAVLSLAAAVSEATVGPGLLRTFLLLSGLTMGVGAVCGIAFAWCPAVVVCSAAVLSPSSTDPLGLHPLIFWGDAVVSQQIVACSVFLLGYVLAVLDVASRGYIRSLPSVGKG